jgi:short-subunit dehydrogenase
VLAGVRDPDAFEPIDGVEPIHLDLSSREQIDATDLPPLDLLVNNAGQFVGGLLEDQDLEAVYSLFQVNLVAVAHLTHRVLPGMLARRRGTILNNASIIGYAHFPAASTYAASKAGVVAFSESLRRELDGTGVNVLHAVTPGVDTRMLDATEDVYDRHMDTSRWEKVEPAEWAEKVLEAVEEDRHIVGPGGRTAYAKLASRGPAFVLDAVLSRTFSRSPRS